MKENLASQEVGILLIEDDIFIADIYQKKFKSLGFFVEVASDGNLGLKKLQEFLPQIILLDVTMPRMDGLEVLKVIKQNPTWAQIPIMILSNISEKEKVEKALELGAVDYLIKSHFTPMEVVAKLKKVLGLE